MCFKWKPFLTTRFKLHTLWNSRLRHQPIFKFIAPSAGVLGFWGRKKSMLLQTKPQPSRTNAHECKLSSWSRAATMWNCNARCCKLRTITKMRHVIQSCSQHWKSRTANTIVMHDISDAVTPQIANSARRFDSQFQPQESRFSRDNAHCPCPSCPQQHPLPAASKSRRLDRPTSQNRCWRTILRWTIGSSRLISSTRRHVTVHGAMRFGKNDGLEQQCHAI